MALFADGGLALMDRLWRKLEGADATQAPLARWLLLGALRPWLAAARAWGFTAAPAAQPVWAISSIAGLFRHCDMSSMITCFHASAKASMLVPS